jgi:hypothetical protein
VTAPISEPHVYAVCRLGARRDCCRYLLNVRGNFCCGKHTSLRETIDARVAAGEHAARGDKFARRPGDLLDLAIGGADGELLEARERNPEVFRFVCKLLTPEDIDTLREIATWDEVK